MKVFYKMIKVSIITVTWNCASNIASCLESVRSQRYEFIEHIIVDGASTDGTADIIRKSLRPGDKFISEADSGIYDAINKGIRMATGDIVGFLHSDDVFFGSNVINEIVSAFEVSEVDLVYANLYYVKKDDHNGVVRRWVAGRYSKINMLFGWMHPHPTLYVRRELYKNINYFDISFRISSDYHSVLKLFMIPGVKSYWIKSPLLKMRVGGASNASLKNMILKSSEDFRVLRSVGFCSLCSCFVLLMKNVRKFPQFIFK